MNCDELVSIIIPVYNVEAYIDDCLMSVINQTYKNLEILLINDGSTDCSEKKCIDWAERDSRISLFNKSNEGLGPTRNFGVDHANGEWIVFIDADDWVDETFIMKMYQTAKENNADLVDCNYFQVSTLTGNKKNLNGFLSLGIRLSPEYNFVYGHTSICTLFISKYLLVDYNIQQPNCRSEDYAIKLLLKGLAKRYEIVDEPLYFYRKERPGAITTGKSKRRLDVSEIASPWLVKGLKQHGVYEKKKNLIFQHIIYAMSKHLFGGWFSEDEEEYYKVLKAYKEGICDCFSEYKHCSILQLGGWNLFATLRYLPYIQDANLSFQFSSLISLMHPFTETLDVPHKSPFRRKMIERDLYSDFWRIIENEKPEYLVLDFLEERHDIIKLADSSYITKSDAFEECGMLLKNTGVLSSGSEEWKEEWENCCKKFMDKIQHYIGFNKVVLVKNYLTKTHGDVYKQQYYENIEWIKEHNETIATCYQFVQDHYPEIQVVDLSNDINYITDEKYEYGVYPWYLNTIIYYKMSEIIKDKINCGVMN